uniref:Dolichol-phosphate mannosyltransferase n=1 Tax=Candidatus Kentrum sp. UNK TaxID=2126344 RepID=A0A451B0L8_9GAMM|nr:MAG: dolichol-phosphate mannosyltransferase [Candidatus Kentron sp. UNK]VFK71824.1 MAG: dolichol-phosphate mannosyltransferase [Candidatus Kentron sp. UNK]
MKTSLIIPFRDEAAYAEKTIKAAHAYLSERHMEFELIAIDDSTDGTYGILQSLAGSFPNIVVAKGEYPPGYGKALRKGFDLATGEIVVPFNGDLSDSLDDLLSYIRLIEAGYDMVFGSRFMVGATVTGQGAIKGLISRLGNGFLQWLFRADCSDITNSFKAYGSAVLEVIEPTANGYEIGMEIALKGILGEYRYTTIPISWSGRKHGRSKMSIMKSIPTYLNTAVRIRFSYS